MTLLETTKLINYVAASQPNINTVIESGDIFDLNKENFEVDYSAFCATQRTHTITDEFINFNFVLYYVDRLTLDLSNKIEVQSTAIETLNNIRKTLYDMFLDTTLTVGDIETFTQRFTAECAGAYMYVTITTTPGSLCAEMVNELGEFAPEEFSDDFFKWANGRM